MSDSDREPAEKPTRDEQTAEREGKTIIRDSAGIAVVSIVLMLAIVLAMMQTSGMISLFAPDGAGILWGVLLVLGLVVIGLVAWRLNAVGGR